MPSLPDHKQESGQLAFTVKEKIKSHEAQDEEIQALQTFGAEAHFEACPHGSRACGVAASPCGAETRQARNRGERTKAAGSRARLREDAGRDTGCGLAGRRRGSLSWCAGGAGGGDPGLAGPAKCRLRAGTFAGVWASGTPAGTRGEGGRGGKPLTASGPAPCRTSRPPPAPEAPRRLAHLPRTAVALAAPPSPAATGAASARAMKLRLPRPPAPPSSATALTLTAPPVGRVAPPSAQPHQSQASATAAEPMSNELLQDWGRWPYKQLRLGAVAPCLCLPLPPLPFTFSLVAVQRPHPPSVLSLSNQILPAGS